jgi:hypothetical protein
MMKIPTNFGLFFPYRLVCSIAVALRIALALLVAGRAQAAVVTLSFSGTYNTGPSTVFGEFGAAVPYNFQITYDTTLNTNSFFFPTGAFLGSQTTTHEWHGYSASGITATSLTFGSQTWTAGNVSPRIPAIGVSADLWFDTDISIAAPTRCWIFFDGGSPGVGALELGAGAANAVNIFMEQTSSVFDNGFPGGAGFSSLMTITAPPRAPSTVVIDGCNSGVPNTLFPSGRTFADLIAACAADPSKHGKFVRCVSDLTNDLKKTGIITEQQKDAIQRCAAEAQIR